jgi:hypothetical protein
VEAATTGTPLLERRVRELETSNRALASQLVQFDRRGGKRKQLTLLLFILWCCGVVAVAVVAVAVVDVLMVCCSFGSTVTDVFAYLFLCSLGLFLVCVHLLYVLYVCCTLHGFAGGSNPLSSSQSRKAGERFKRERDLEGVIESQNRVIMKMQSENERLTKRGVSASKIIEAQKELRSLRRRNKEFQAERQTLLDKAAAASSAKLDSGRAKDLVR